MDGGHESLLDAEFVVDNLGKRSETVGGAGGVGDDVHGVIVLLVIDTDNEHGCIGRGSGDNDLLGTSLHMHGCLFGSGEDTSGFDDVVGTGITPGDLGRVHLTKDLNGLSVNCQSFGIHIMRDFLVGASVNGVIFVHIFHVVNGDEGVVDSYDVDVGVFGGGTHDETVGFIASDGKEQIIDVMTVVP
jgi:hypothetical protein